MESVAWTGGMLVGLVSLVLAFGPPVLPPDLPVGGEAPEPSEPPASEAPVEPPPSEAPPSSEPPIEAPSSEPPSEPPIEAPPSEPVPEEEPITVTPPPAEPPVEGPVAPSEPTSPAVQRPGGSTPTPTPVAEPKPVAPAPTVTPTPAPVAAEPEPEPDGPPPAAEREDEPKKKLGGFRLARLGVAAKLGYTNGVSQKNGIFDRNKSLQDSIDNQSPTVSGGGDLGTTRFGGFQGGFALDAEVVGINAWFDFHKFFRPGGMWSVLLGYDHEFGFGERYRLDVGVGAGVQKVFLGRALESLYYDKSNPTAVNIGTLGLEARAMADFHIKIIGPLFTGPYAMIGYHYLWSANAAEVTAEKGMHFSLGWTLRIDLATPKLLGRGKNNKKK